MISLAVGELSLPGAVVKGIIAGEEVEEHGYGGKDNSVACQDQSTRSPLDLSTKQARGGSLKVSMAHIRLFHD